MKALIAFGGKKAAGVLAKFLQDEDVDMQLAAAHALADFSGAGGDEAERLTEFLEKLSLKKKDQKLNIAAIKALGSTGGNEAALFLQRYDRIRWWRSRPLQEELRSAAQKSIQEITRREGDGGRPKR
jgi:hypothetical protein